VFLHYIVDDAGTIFSSGHPDRYLSFSPSECVFMVPGTIEWPGYIPAPDGFYRSYWLPRGT